MDYTYYPAPSQHFQYIGLPPTPAHSYDVQDEAGTDMPEVYDAANSYPAFDHSFQFSRNPLFPPQQRAQPHSPPISTYGASISSIPQPDSSNRPVGHGEYDQNDQRGNHSSSEEKETLTPAQSRRKAQNRAAQRAFRERKERRVKDLESKLNTISAHSSSLLSDNERLKRELQKLATQNEILRATTSSSPSLRSVRPPSPLHGPLTYTPTDFVNAVGVDLHNQPLSYDNFDGAEGDRLLAAGATWDYIQAHEMYRKDMVDVADVCRRLRGRATCDGRGPVFRESEVRKAIEESVMSGGDELI